MRRCRRRAGGGTSQRNAHDGDGADDLRFQAFLYVGGIEDVRKRAAELAKG